MNSSDSRPTMMRILTFVATIMLSTTALAVSLTWEFGGQSVDGRDFSARMSFDDSQLPISVITETRVVEDAGNPTGPFMTHVWVIEQFDVDALRFTLGADVTGSAIGGSIIQGDGPGGIVDDEYMVDAITSLTLPGSGSITGTLVIQIMGNDFFNSLLVSTTPLENALPGTFQLFGGTANSNAVGFIDSVTNVTGGGTPMPLPWTIGLMASGLGSLLFLTLAGFRSRRKEE